MIAYTPRLDSAELNRAAGVLETAAGLAAARGEDTQRAGGRIAGTGFAGPAANAGLARLSGLADAFCSHADIALHNAHVLRITATMQDMLDAHARRATEDRNLALIIWLNCMAWLLENTAAEELLVGTSPGGPFPPPFSTRPLTPLDQLHAELYPQIPPPARQAVDRYGATILETGPGGTSVIVGKTTDPARIITLVAGVTTGEPDALGEELAKATRIAEATDSAVVVWQGYDPPELLAGGVFRNRADREAAKLAAFQLGVEDRFPHARKTIVAHSYGTTLTGLASRDPGLFADDVWLLGSPGVPVARADAMRLYGADPEVFVVDASDDPILALRSQRYALHGVSPSDPSFGATRVGGVEGDHGAYFTDPDFLDALSTLPFGG